MRRAFGLVPVALAVAAVAITETAAATQLQTNQAAARIDARRLLQSLRLPGGVTSIPREPSYATSLLGSVQPAGRYAAEEVAFWSTTTRARDIIAYVRAHPPAGAEANPGTGSGSDSKTGVTSLEVQFSWPDLGRQVLDRRLTVSVVTPSHGGSVIIAQSQSNWAIPRPAGERVPAGVHAVAVSLRIGSGPQGTNDQRTTTHAFTSPATVAAIVREFDSLPIVQPSQMMACPMMLADRPELTLDFRSGASGDTLARAQVSVTPGAYGYSGWNSCDAIQFSIGGRQQTPLVSETFVRRIGGLIGTRIS